MTNKASGRSAALLATLLMLGFAGASHAASGTISVWPQVSAPQVSAPQVSAPQVSAPQAASTSTQPRSDTQVVTSDQLNDADRTIAEPAQTAQSAVAAPTSQPYTQGQSVVPVVARSDEGSDTVSLIGKIFIGFGTLLTLGSSAARMLMG
jgi:hypothetical protein